MNPLSLIGFMAFFVVALVVGLRLLLLWRRTRQLPELLMGIGVLGIGPIGFGAMMVGVVTTSNPLVANGAYAVGTLAVAIGVLAKCTFNWLVYRRESVLAKGVTCSVGALLFAVILAGFEEHWAYGWAALFVWAWGCGAVGLYFNVMRFFK